MKNHKAQIAMSVIISLIFIALFIGYALLYCVIDGIPILVKIGCSALMTGLAVGMAAILMQRIREIRKGENDDLNNY